MDTFYWMVPVIACILLIIGLIVFSMLLKKSNVGAAFPLVSLPCPDGWHTTLSGDKIHCESVWSDGSTNNWAAGCDSSSNPIVAKSGSSSQYAYIVFDTTKKTCDRKVWTDKFQIKWDGVSNYNPC